MNYADIKLGTWYPQGGMYKIVEGMFSVAEELGVKFVFNADVTEIKVAENMAKSVVALTTNNILPGMQLHFFREEMHCQIIYRRI